MLVFRKKNNDIIVVKETKEKSLYKESTFYRHLANTVNKKLGVDMIPKEMAKDSNLTSDGRFYLVDRKRRYAFIQNDWDSYDINRDYFNKNMPVELSWNWLQDDDALDQLTESWKYLPLWEVNHHGYVSENGKDGNLKLSQVIKITIYLTDGTKFIEATAKTYEEAVQKVINAGILF